MINSDLYTRVLIVLHFTPFGNTTARGCLQFANCNQRKSGQQTMAQPRCKERKGMSAGGPIHLKVALKPSDSVFSWGRSKGGLRCSAFVNESRIDGLTMLSILLVGSKY